MSYLKTKQALITQLLATPITGITGADIAFENNDFNPTGKSLWLACYFIPATSETLGKTTASSDEQRGIFQVSVFVALNSINYDNAQLTAIDEILSGFLYNTNIVYNVQKVDILTSEVNNGSESEAWFQRDISINYLTFSERI
tara:strand:- start:3 stop:431 length:429 start_codon:yes stop_codon:yes gene_type:complete